MPIMSEEAKLNPRLLRQFIYGRGKSKKTTWAVRAAECGYNVLHIDGDDGGHILWQDDDTKKLPSGKPDGIISKTAWSRVTTVNVVDTFDRAVFAAFLAHFCRNGNSFLWDEQNKQIAYGSVCDPNHSHIMFNPSSLTPNDVIIVDSWTALSASTFLQFAKENDIDMSEADKVEWPGFGFQGRFLDFVLGRLKAFNCHVIIIGHETVYEKYGKKPGEEKASLISQTTQPISCSGPHAKKLDGVFSDVLYFEKQSDVAFYINTGGDKTRLGGSRHFPGAQFRFADLPISKFFEKANSSPAVDTEPSGWKFYPAGEKPALAGASGMAPPKASKVITPQNGAEVKLPNGGGLMARLKAGG